MVLRGLCSAPLLLAMLQQVPGPQPEAEHRFPIDQPQQAPQRGNQRRIDVMQLKREAEELAKLADEIPPAFERANKGVLSKDLNDRLKRIAKLSKQLRRELSR